MIYKKYLSGILALGIWAGAIAADGKARANPPFLTAPRMTAPVLDGKINPGEWEQAKSTGKFVSSKAGDPITPETRVRIGYDDNNLYILYQCAEVPGTALRADRFNYHDADVWYNDSAEMIFRPDLDRKDYFQFLADSLNQRYDAYLTDHAGYNPVWKSVFGRGEDHWVLEIAIPLSAISATPPTTGTVWQADFFRSRNGGAHLSAWAPVPGGHDQIRNYGYLCFGSAKQAALRLTGFLDSVPEALRKLDSPELRKLLKRGTDLKRTIENGDEALAERNYQQWRTELRSLAAALDELSFAARYAASGSPAVIQAGDAYSVELPTRAGLSEIKDLNASFMIGEVRNFALNLTNISPQTLTLRLALRYGSDFDTLRLGIPGYRVAWHAVETVATLDGSPSADVVRPNPGGVYRIAPGETVQALLSVEAQKAIAPQHGFLTVQAIDGSTFAPRSYPVTFRTANRALADAPDQPLSFGWDGLSAEILRDAPEFTDAHFQMLRDYGFNMVMISSLHRLPRPRADADGNLIGKLDFTRLEELLKAVNGKFDAYYFNVDIWEKNDLRTDLFGLDFFSPAYEKAFKQWLTLVLAKFQDLGIDADKLVICPYDESVDKRAVMIARWIKEVNPRARILIDCSSDDLDQIRALDRYTDIWMPHVRTLNQEGFQDFYNYLEKSGKILMTYYYSSGNNEKLKSPYEDYALKFWTCYTRNLRGLGYWAAGQYYGDPWYRKSFTGNYDTALMYPVEYGVVPARRLLGWRRGIQDFQLLKLAERQLAENGGAAQVAELKKMAAEVAANPGNPALAEKVRDFCRNLWLNGDAASAPRR